MYGKLNIVADNGALAAVCGPKEVKAALAPWDRDTFKFTWPDTGDTDDLNLAVFTIGPDGHAQSLSLNWDGTTEFKRVEVKPAPEGPK